jgi:S-formylglutathione hydrolase FrmB
MGQKMTARHQTKTIRASAWSRAAIAIAAAGLFSAQAQAAGFLVEVNQSKALHLSAPATAVMVGNPAIADVSVLGPQLVYVLGRSYGKTNIIALDASGKQITELNIDVVAPSGSTVTLTRGAGQLTYNCTPRCERTVAQGDSTVDFDTAVKQTGDTSGLASGTATSADASSGVSLSIGGGSSSTPK